MADNKKLREQNKKTSDSRKNIDVNKKVLDQQKAELERQSNLQEIQNKIQTTQLTAQKLKDAGDTKNAEILERSLQDIIDTLENNKNSAAVAKRLSELVTLEENAQKSADLISKDLFRNIQDQVDNKGEREKEKLENTIGSTNLQDLTKKLQFDKEGEEARGTLGTNDLGKRIDALSLGARTSEDKERAETLKKAFTDAQSNLQKAMASGDEEQIKLARKQIQNLEQTVKTDEEFREERDKADKSQSTLLRISEGIKGFNDKLSDMAKGGGFVAGLAGIVLAVFSPETLSNIVMKVVDWFSTLVDSLEAIVNGDFEEFKNIFNDNLALFSGLFGLALFYFGPALFGGIFRVLKALKTFRAFMLVTALPSLYAFFTGMIASIGAALVPMLPIIAIGAAIALLIGGLLYGFNKLKESLGPGATIMDTLKVAALYFVDFLAMLVNGITFIPRKIIGFLGKRAAKWLFGDDVDTSMFDKISEGLRTDRGKTAAAEIRAKNEAAEAERLAQEQLEKERQSKIGTGEGFDMSQLTTENADILADLQAQGFEMPPMALQTTNQSNVSNSQSTTIVTERPSRATIFHDLNSSAVFR